MNIREATLADIPALKECEQAVIEYERALTDCLRSDETYYYDLEKLIASPDSKLIVVDVAGAVIATGYARIEKSLPSRIHDRHGYLGFMFVHPDYRGQKINQKVMDYLIAWSKAQGVFHFYLDVYAENESAIRAYEKLGFKPNAIEMKLTNH